MGGGDPVISSYLILHIIHHFYILYDFERTIFGRVTICRYLYNFIILKIQGFFLSLTVTETDLYVAGETRLQTLGTVNGLTHINACLQLNE